MAIPIVLVLLLLVSSLAARRCQACGVGHGSHASSSRRRLRSATKRRQPALFTNRRRNMTLARVQSQEASRSRRRRHDPEIPLDERSAACRYDLPSLPLANKSRHLQRRPLPPGPGRYVRHSCKTKSPSIWETGEMGVAFGSFRSRKSIEPPKNYTIPVHFCAYTQDERVGQLLPIHITGFMNHLNLAFAGSSFRFEAKSVRNMINPAGWRCNNLDALARQNRIPGAAVLNVYTCDMNQIGGFARATFPPNAQVPEKKDIDGVFIVHPYLGRNGVLEVYKAMVHEVGHWLGLLHTFEHGCKTTVSARYGFKGFPSWIFDGDGVDDTAAQERPSWDYPGWQGCFVNQNRNIDTCRDVPGIDSGRDAVRNYMNYIHESCMSEFTPGQHARMLSQYEAFRLAPQADPERVAACFQHLTKKKGGCRCNPKRPGGSAKCAQRLVKKKCGRLFSKVDAQRNAEATATMGRWDEFCPRGS